ncbi:MAG TPA: BON domain-containing protein [Phycisphaerales bacterium]|nr:BON domain-containing protein [Phycisphaerales bacterium]
MTTRTLLASLLTIPLALAACERAGDNTRPAPARPDNTANNAPDRDMDATKTPVDASNDREDVELAAAIRRAIVQDDALSMNAKNCKIIAEKGGVVTLRGVVDTQAEKDAVEQKARQVTGVRSVTNNLEVKPSLD